MTGVKVESNLQAFASKFGIRLTRQLISDSKTVLQHVSGNIRTEINAWTSRTSERKTGALARSFRPGVMQRGGAIEMGVYSDLPYARIHETGGVITPKNGKYLTIPISPTARLKAAREWTNLKFVHHPPHNPVLATTTKGGKVIKPHYILVKSVKITPKKYITKASRRSALMVSELLKRPIQIAIDGASK